MNGKKIGIHALPTIRCPQITLPGGKDFGNKNPKMPKAVRQLCSKGVSSLNPAGCNFVSLQI